jgi:hypothetical protein
VSSNRARGEATGHRSFPIQLATWLATDYDLIDALITLRRLGLEGRQAVEAVLDIKRVNTMRLSLDLWSALVDDDGDDPDALLMERLPARVLDRLRLAIYDASPVDDAQLLSVVSGP